MPTIQLLPPLVANQIAAGEVVERPASVVKELLENSLDAGAKRIDIHIKKAGKQLIRITDDGCGIASEQLPLALSRHATSKINQLADLAHIVSLGFRGEALASIASVAKLRLVSNTGEKAWQISVVGDECSDVTAAAHPQGTTIEARELFFNTPVRRKFLRTDKTEYLKIDDTIKRIALSHCDVAFSLTHNDQLVFQLPAAISLSAQEKRVAKICGQRFITQSEAVDAIAEELQLRGWLNCADGGRAHSNLQYVFLNGRMVRDKLINHAIRSALTARIADGRYAAYVLYLRCDPATVDVNVHPTKHEVRFHQPRLLHDFIVSSLQRQFAQAEPEPEPELISEPQPIITKVAEPPAIYQAPPQSISAPIIPPKAPIPPQQMDWVSPAAAIQTVAAKPPPTETPLTHYVNTIKNRYLLLEQMNALLVVDTHQLWREWLAQQTQLPSCELASPVKLVLTASQQTQLAQQAEQLQQWGFIGEIIDDDHYRLRAIPECGEGCDWHTALPTLLSNDAIMTSFVRVIAAADTEGKKSFARWQKTPQAIVQRIVLPA